MGKKSLESNLFNGLLLIGTTLNQIPLPIILLNNIHATKIHTLSDNFIEIISEGLMPDTSRTKLTIDNTGKSIHQFQESQIGDTSVEESKFVLSPDKLDKIREIIDNSSFFDLESQDSEVIDGDQVQLTVTKDNESHSVLLMNKPLKEFDDIIKQINKVLSEKYRISYNTLVLEQNTSGDI